jgi:hypothetical protein
MLSPSYPDPVGYGAVQRLYMNSEALSSYRETLSLGGPVHLTVLLLQGQIPLTLKVTHLLLAVRSRCNDFNPLAFLCNLGYLLPAGFILPFKCCRNCVRLSLVECKKNHCVESKMALLSQSYAL